MRFASVVLAFVISFGLVGLAFASDIATQTVQLNVDEICVIDVTGNPGALTIVAPTTGGQTPPPDSDNTTYAQYTSVVSGATVTRNVTAEWGSSDAAPAGCQLTLQVTSLTGGCGTAVGSAITLSSTAQNIIQDIHSCATGTGGTDGGRLAYTLEVTNVFQLDSADDQSVTVTLTLTDAS